MTLKSDMLRALEEEDDGDKMKDVTLIGSDGGRVKANKTILAIRSPVFRRMFFGSFQERNSEEVSMDNFPSVVLQVVAKYCYVDELDLDLIFSDDDNDMADCGLTDAEAMALVQVRDAANYLELYDLHKTISNELGESILSLSSSSSGTTNPNSHNNSGDSAKDLACVCAVMQELMARGESDDALFATCLDLVEAQPEACLLPNVSSSGTHNKGILACSLPLVEKLLKSPSIQPFVAVKALKWTAEHIDDDDKEEAMGRLKEIAGNVTLEKLTASQVADIQPCTLFSMERLYKALVYHGKNSPATSHTASAAMPSPFATRFNGTVAAVRGAGVDCLNGVYHKMVGSGNPRFERRGQYGDLEGTFRLEKEASIWKIGFRDFSALSARGAIFLYESTKKEMSSDVPPFALWRCLDGKDPTPYVAVQSRYPMAPFSTGTTTAASVAMCTAALPVTVEGQLADAFRATFSTNSVNNRVRRRMRANRP